jgi:hypothetical protein
MKRLMTALFGVFLGGTSYGNTCTTNAFDDGSYRVTCSKASCFYEDMIKTESFCNEGDTLLYGGCWAPGGWTLDSFTPVHSQMGWRCYFLELNEYPSCPDASTFAYCQPKAPQPLPKS